MKRYLLVGAGTSHDKRIHLPGHCKDFSDGELVTLDGDDALTPNIVADLDQLPYSWGDDNAFDEIHAYEVLEHCGTQGDGKFFFGQFIEFWRMLKPDGMMALSVPLWTDELAWGVPDHKRVMPLSLFGFLDRSYYDNVGKPGYADYRRWMGEMAFADITAKQTENQLYVIMRAVK